MAGTHLDGVHDDPETGHRELVGVPQVVVVQVAGTQETRCVVSLAANRRRQTFLTAGLNFKAERRPIRNQTVVSVGAQRGATGGDAQRRRDSVAEYTDILSPAKSRQTGGTWRHPVD